VVETLFVEGEGFTPSRHAALLNRFRVKDADLALLDLLPTSLDVAAEFGQRTRERIFWAFRELNPYWFSDSKLYQNARLA
jgi:hypothetical protein